jgi:hypothetical protein
MTHIENVQFDVDGVGRVSAQVKVFNGQGDREMRRTVLIAYGLDGQELEGEAMRAVRDAIRN